MFIELAEALDCPDCQAELGLVAFVGELRDRRVVEGYLGCPACARKYPIRGGAIDLRRETHDPAGSRPSAAPRGSAAISATAAPPASAGPCPPERAVQVAALLGVQDRADARMLLDEGLAACAEPVADWGERLEILALVADLESPLREPIAGVTRIAGAIGLPWPFRPRALQGVGLLGGSRPRIAEAKRVLSPGGRLAVFEPTREVVDGVGEEDFEVHAAEALALVATRR